MNNLIRIARPVIVKVASADEDLPPVFIPLAAGQVVRAGDIADDGYQLGVGGDEVDESIYAWALTQFSAN